MTTRCVGRPLCVPTAWMRSSRSMPLVTLPKTTCLPSRWGAGACAGQTHAEQTGQKFELLMPKEMLKTWQLLAGNCLRVRMTRLGQMTKLGELWGAARM